MSGVVEEKCDSEIKSEVLVAVDEKTNSKSPSKKEANDALQHLVQGKRHLLVKDINSAVDSLQEACKLFAEQYGETADQCGEAYFVYGKALLELVRAETGVLGDVGGNESGEDEENEDKEDEEEKEETDKNGESDSKDEENDSEKAECEKTEGNEKTADKISEESAEEAVSSAEHKDSPSKREGDADSANEDGNDEAQEVDTTENQNKEDDEEEEGVSNIQLAWEVLELAKVIFERQPDDRETALKLSQVYLKLGEVSIESENYTQAVVDIKQCLALQQRHLPADSRLIAETHYQQGIAHSLANEFSAAVECFDRALDTIRARIDSLTERVAQNDQAKQAADGSGDGADACDREIAELRALLPDIEEKRADMRQMRHEVRQKLAAALQDGAGPSSLSDPPEPPVSPVKAIMRPQPAADEAAGSSAASSRPVTSISHLVRRKRSSDPAQHTNGDAKKVKLDNGHAQ